MLEAYNNEVLDAVRCNNLERAKSIYRKVATPAIGLGNPSSTLPAVADTGRWFRFLVDEVGLSRATIRDDCHLSTTPLGPPRPARSGKTTISRRGRSRLGRSHRGRRMITNCPTGRRIIKNCPTCDPIFPRDAVKVPFCIRNDEHVVTS